MILYCHSTTIILLTFSGESQTKLWTPFDMKEKEDIDIPIFDFATIANATDNFSIDNKLGEGGFGPVYKVNKIMLISHISSLKPSSLDNIPNDDHQGTLANGQDMAVKRLCNNTGQGPEEF